MLNFWSGVNHEADSTKGVVIVSSNCFTESGTLILFVTERFVKLHGPSNFLASLSPVGFVWASNLRRCCSEKMRNNSHLLVVKLEQQAQRPVPCMMC